MFASRLRPSAALAALILAASAAAPAARAANFMDTLANVAGGYNLYVSGNIASAAQPLSWSDTEGKIAAGGSAYFRGYDVAGKAAGGQALVVGQDLVFQSGTVHGDVVTGGTASFPKDFGGTTVQGTVSAGGGLGVAPTTYSGTAPFGGLPLDFAAVTADLTAASAFLNSADAHAQGTLGTTSNAWGTLTLTSSATGLVFFDLAASDLVGINGLMFDVAPAATVILNLTGQTGGSLTNYGFLGGVQAQQTLFNFVDATSLSLANLGFMGSILAPNADLTGSWGQINGSVMAKSFSGTTQVNLAPFRGGLPNPPPPTITNTAVPEPSTWALTIMGFTSLGAALRRRRAPSLARV